MDVRSVAAQEDRPLAKSGGDLVTDMKARRPDDLLDVRPRRARSTGVEQRLYVGQSRLPGCFVDRGDDAMLPFW